MNEIVKAITELSQISAIGQKKTLSLREAAIYMDMSETALYHRVEEIRHYKPGKMIYFDKCDLDEWMHRNPVMSKNDIAKKAAIYCANKPT